MSAPERLPEHPHQLAIHHIQAAITSLEHAADAPDRDKRIHLQRADTSIGHARDTARAVAAQWRAYNERARALGAWLDTQEGPPAP